MEKGIESYRKCGTWRGKREQSKYQNAEKNSILHMIGAGMSHSAVARYFVMPRSTLSSIVKRSKQSFGLQPKKRGRKIKLSERGLRKMVH